MDTAPRRIALNTLLLSVTELLTRLVSLVLVICVARRLGPEMMGIYAFALTFVNLFDIFVNFGLDRYIQREVGRQPDLTGPLFSQVFTLKLLAYLAAAVVTVILSVTVVDSGLKRWVIWLLSLSLFFRTNITSSNSFFRAHQQAKYEALVVISFRVVYGGAGLAAILSGQGLLTLAGLELAAQGGACVLAWWLFIKKIGNPFHRVTFNSLLELARSTKDFLLIRVVLTIFASLNMFMLSFMAGDVVTGFYSAALRLSSSFDFLPEAFTGAFLPELSRRCTQGWEAFGAVFRPYFKYLLIIGLGLAAVLGGLAEGFILLVFGPAFTAAIPTLSLLALTLALDFTNLSVSTALIALNRENRIVRIFLAAAAFNFSLNLFLVPAYRQNGAVGATLAAEILVLFLQLRTLGWGLVRDLGLGRMAARPLLAGLLAFGWARVLALWQMDFFPTLALMALGFLLLLFFTGALSREEWLAAWEAIKLKRKEWDTA
ncbi:MAG: flippase [Deltaproteobacteria bacterium]|nr:flippase [Deltaproteobacteria bacterium]MBI4796848.1 flippase [Deltaproteobacteria bacterium]